MQMFSTQKISSENRVFANTYITSCYVSCYFPLSGPVSRSRPLRAHPALPLLPPAGDFPLHFPSVRIIFQTRAKRSAVIALNFEL